MAQPLRCSVQKRAAGAQPWPHLSAGARARCVPDPRRADPHHELTINAVRFCFCSGSGQSPRARARRLLRRLLSASQAPRPLFKTPAAHHQCCAASLLLLRPKPPPARVRARVGSFIDCSARTRRDHSPGRQPTATHRLQARARLERYVRPNSQAHRIILQPSPTYLTPKKRRGLCTAPPPAQAP